MAVITITELPRNLSLDRKAMSSIRGGSGGGWVFGAFRPYVAPSEGSGFGGSSIVNLYQITNNNFYVENMKSQTISLNNSGSNSTVNAVLIGG
jgi:hypothetical protein